MGKIIKLIERKDGEIGAPTLLLPKKNTVNRQINLLHPLETALVTDKLNRDSLSFVTRALKKIMV